MWLFFIASDFWWLCPKIWFQKAFLCRWYFCITCSRFYTITVSWRTQTTNSSQHWNPHASYDVDTTSVEKQQVHSFLDCTFPSSAFDPMLVLSKKSQAANLVLCRYHKHIHHNVFTYFIHPHNTANIKSARCAQKFRHTFLNQSSTPVLAYKERKQTSLYCIYNSSLMYYYYQHAHKNTTIIASF